MPNALPRLPVLFAFALMTCGLGGCGTINANLAAGMGDYVPRWAGGLPADAPPRPGTARYDEYMQERERKRLEPAKPKDQATETSPSSADAIR